jgi:3-oxoacyl-[acyl-carrier-protein] synthase I
MCDWVLALLLNLRERGRNSLHGMRPISILASGMVTAVGLDASSSCAAIRCGIDGFSETRFMDKGGEWIIGAQVPLEQPWRGLPKLLHMVVPAIRECLAHIGTARPEEIPLLLGVAEKQRPGRFQGLDDQLSQEVQTALGVRFHPRSAVIAQGRVAGAIAMGIARELVYDKRVPCCIIAGVDTYLVAATLADHEANDRLLTSLNPNGFIPGEAAAAVLVSASPSPRHPARSAVTCFGMGTGLEKVTINSEEPLRADGLVQAFNAAFADAQRGYEHVDYRLTDCNGEQYWFKEAALAMTRTLRRHKSIFDIWHPADCIGEAGAANVLCAFAVGLAAASKRYAPGHGLLCHFGSDDGQRFAFVLAASSEGNT